MYLFIVWALSSLLVAGDPVDSVTDVARMKLDALLGRAGRKDFHDLYAICRTQSLRELQDLVPRKYPVVRDF